MRNRRPILIFIMAGLNLAISCQPPTPVYQQDPQPVVNTVDIPAVAPPPPPVPPSPPLVLPMGNSITDEGAPTMRMGVLSNGVSLPGGVSRQSISGPRRKEFDPYPGYIPPPPEFPTLHSPDQRGGPVGPPLFAQTNDVGNSVVNPPSANQGLSCPVEIRTLADFASCIQPTQFSLSDKKSTICDFEEGTYCRFQPTSSLLQMGRLSLSSHYASVAELSGRSVMFQPDGNFAYVLSQHPLAEDEEITLSSPISCQNGNGVLKFDYWLIGDRAVTIKVCTQDNEARSCTKPIVYTDTSTVAVEVVHPQADEFDVEIVASNLSKPNLFILDNVDYRADLCEEATKQNPENTAHPSEEQVNAFFDDSATSHHGDIDSAVTTEETADRFEHPTTAILPDHEEVHESPPEQQSADEETSDTRQAPTTFKNLAACQLLTCAFTTSMCQYKNYQNSSMSLAEWKLGNQRVGNIHTGIKGEDEDAEGGFLFVGTDSSTLGLTTYILESPKFFLDDDVVLIFDVYRRSKDITLQVCLDSPFYCPYSASPFDKRIHWKQGESFGISKNVTKIFFKAIQWRKFKWLAIDNIRLAGC